MKNPSLIFQNKFSGNSLKVIKKYFNIPEENTVLFALWTGRLLGKPVRERGFVFTNRGLIWFFPVVSVSGENDENAERSQRDFDFLPKDNIEFKLAYSKTDGITKELHLKTSVSEYIYIFPGDTSPEIISEIESIVRNYFTGDFDVNAYSEKVKKHSVLLGLLNVPDFFSTFGEKVKTEWEKFNGKVRDFFTSEKAKIHNKQQSKQNRHESSTQKEKVENEAKVTVKEKSQFLCHVFDLCADILLITSIIFLLRSPVPKSDNVKDIFIFFRYLIAFYIIKLDIILTKKDSQKAVSLLLLIITFIAILLIIFANIQIYTPIFLIGLIIITLLILLAIQFALCYSKKTIKRKVIIFIIGVIIVVPMILDEAVRNTIINTVKNTCDEIFKVFRDLIVSVLSFWWTLFKQ
ncbi:MAG: hypothetical protein K6C98_04345 [Treponema sp.]|nr:hypothetical protein [Treponema sp.]